MSATDTLRLLHNTPVSRSSLQYLVGEAYFQKLRALRPFASAVHIKSLPVEVLTVILLLAPDRFDECPEAWWKSVLLLGCVCSRWWHIVTSAPSFASSIAVTHRTSPSSLSSRLSQSKAAPLSLAFRFHTFDSSVSHEDTFPGSLRMIDDLLGPVMCRCVWISIAADCFENGYDVLRCLSSMRGPRVLRASVEIPRGYRRVDEWVSEEYLVPSVLFGGHTPLLDSMRVSLSILPWDESVYSNLTSLHLVGIDDPAPTVGDLFSLFSAACSVEQLVIKDVPCMDYDLAVDPFPVTDTVLPRLTHLSLEVKDYVDSCVFDTLVLPSLQRLHVRTDFEEGTKGVAGHLARAGRRLRFLTFETAVRSAETLKDLMKAFPSVTSVDCRGSDSDFALLLHAAAVHWRGLWPDLQELWMDNTFPDEMIIFLLRGLTGLSSPRARVVSPIYSDTSGYVTVPGSCSLRVSSKTKQQEVVRSDVSTDMPIFSL
ncbi:hypothetical protein R3P38DRAFT_3206565 [Favolaschia claudopus]|uniref:F-box domain-containing protein n=2 Tax=Favolaschia claudopus TaxID=2862362 RepID=A0AAW0ALD3_9AGAR